MTTDTSVVATESLEVQTPANELRRLREEVTNDPAALAAYQDTYQRAALLAAGPRIRKSLGMTQRAVSKIMGTTQSAVSDLESGRVEPQLSTLQRYARTLDRRFDFTFVDQDLPAFTEGTSNALFDHLKEQALSPLLTTLATQPKRARTLNALSGSVPLPEVLLGHILSELQDKGWATSEGHDKDRVYSLNDDAAYVIGVSLHRDRIVAVLMDLNKDLVTHVTRTLQNSTRKTVTEVTVDIVDHLFRCAKGKQIIGVGVSVAGVVRADTGRVEYAPDLQSSEDWWKGVDLEKILQDKIVARIGVLLRVAVENDANALALHEHQQRGDQSVAVILLSGVGIGAGLVLNGELAAGAHSAAGEGGHAIVDPNGPKCRNGSDHYGCLETMASAQGILTSLGIPAGTSEEVADGLAAANDRVRNGDSSAKEAFVNAGGALGRFLTTIIVLLDPSRTVLYGHPELTNDRYASALAFNEGVGLALEEAKKTRLHLVPDPRMERHALTENIGAVAAGAAAMRHFLALPSRWAPSLRTTDVKSA